MKNIGIDISKRKCVVCIMDGKGKVLEEASYDNTLEGAKEFARRMKKEYGRKGPCRAACESTANMWLKTFEAFEECGIPVKLANTYKMKIISDTDVKTDPIDARKIANALRVGIIPECYVAPPDLRDVRELLRYRIGMVQARTALINYTHGLLDKYDVTLDASTMYSKKAISLLLQMNLERPNDNMILQNCARGIAHATGEISSIEEEIDRQAAANEDAKLLMSMTGIEAFAAMLLVSEIGDIFRFKTADRLVSWTGMCPRVYQSGNVTHHGHMKKASNRRVNWIMIQAANVAVRHDDRLKLFYLKTKIRHGGNHPIAITHVANKMVRIIWKMLTAKDSNPRCAIWHLMQTDQWGRAQTILMYHQKDRLRRDMMNNGKIYESVEKVLRESIVPSAEVSKRYNATYGASDFNVGMLHAAMLDTSVGGCSFAMREITAQSIENPRYSRHSPSDEWFRDILSKTDEGKALETFNQAVRAQLDELCLFGRLPDVLDVAIDMHLIPCHSKKLGSDLRGGERKSGTNRFEAYITAQCVNSKSRLILAALYMDKSSSVHESLREILNSCLENVSAVGSRLGLILVDRGFFSVNSISEIERLSLEYLMPCTRTSRVKDSLRKFVAKTLGPVSKSDMTNSDKATVQYHMIIAEKKRVRKESEGAKNGDKKAGAPEDRYIAFATNAPWMDVEEYSKRWTIETCYRLVENARAKSFGSSRPARLFCFLYSLMLFNAWVLVNAQLASFLKLRDGVLPVTQLYMKIVTLIAIYRNITIQPEPPPDPVAP